MKRGFICFCGKVVLFLLLMLLVDRGVGCAFTLLKDKGLERNPESMWLKTAYLVEKVNSDLVVIGSSKASHHYVTSLLGDSLNMSVYNCGQDGCFYLYQNCVINMLLDRYSPKVIVWDIQPSCFDLNGDMKEYQNIRYLSPYYYNSGWVSSYVNGESGSMALKMKSKMFAYNSKAFNYAVPLVYGGAVTENGYLPLPVGANNLQRLGDKPQSSVEYRLDESKLELFEQTVRRCAESGVELKVIVSPEYGYKSSVFMGAISDLRRLSQEYGAEFEDYSSVTEFMDNPQYFKDAAHLNDDGARLFTNMLINNI